ncbi:MAG TPA: riboflavin synthase, partial [Acidobacteriaceae bacterium]|nr:riboflavin synthase [Acidobacteriaceae bacterium]
MFTGLIETTGKILSFQPTEGAARLLVSGPASLLQRLHIGDSVAVSGVCLTALDIDAKAYTFGADLGAETLARTTLSHLGAGS